MPTRLLRLQQTTFPIAYNQVLHPNEPAIRCLLLRRLSVAELELKTEGILGSTLLRMRQIRPEVLATRRRPIFQLSALCSPHPHEHSISRLPLEQSLQDIHKASFLQPLRTTLLLLVLQLLRDLCPKHRLAIRDDSSLRPLLSLRLDLLVLLVHLDLLGLSECSSDTVRSLGEGLRRFAFSCTRALCGMRVLSAELYYFCTYSIAAACIYIYCMLYHDKHDHDTDP